MKNIYILSDTKVDGALALPVIKQKFFSCNKNLHAFDYLIFTSKNGVLAAQNIDPSWRTVPAISIGKATSNMIRKMGGKIFLESDTGYGEELAKTIIMQIPKEKKLLHIRPKVVVTSLKELLQPNGYFIDECIAYETVCIDCTDLQKPPQGSIIIFSSPSTVRCFLNCFDWDESYKAIAIGKKTADVLPSYIDAKLPKEQTIKACIELAKSL